MYNSQSVTGPERLVHLHMAPTNSYCGESRSRGSFHVTLKTAPAELLLSLNLSNSQPTTKVV